ncbi:hypothetical protein ABEB36_013859 [Hypothenemus hampei]|uniref:Uncharacterized protein n=1 Tax=Hypothenemus hampei TaxID=57062 RepID=A0ABD1E5H9_HYPHA
MIGRWPTYFLYVTAYVTCLRAAAISNDVPMIMAAVPQKSLNENPQVDNDELKRGWKTDFPLDGTNKRGWNNLRTNWGKRDIGDDDLDLYQKRSWQKLQGSWGKRTYPSDEDDDMVHQWPVPDPDSIANDNNVLDYYVYYFNPEQVGDFDGGHEVNKRNWRSFPEGWGKRSNKWDKFRGSWGKRQPAWNNLKGLWGKRSISE